MNKNLLKGLGITEICVGFLTFIIRGAIGRLIYVSEDAEELFTVTLYIFLGLLVIGLINLWISRGKINKIIINGGVIEIIGFISAVILLLLGPITMTEMGPVSLWLMLISSFPLIVLGFLVKLIGGFIAKKSQKTAQNKINF